MKVSTDARRSTDFAQLRPRGSFATNNQPAINMTATEGKRRVGVAHVKVCSTSMQVLHLAQVSR